MESIPIKMVLVGDPTVGKTSLAQWYLLLNSASKLTISPRNTPQLSFKVIILKSMWTIKLSTSASGTQLDKTKGQASDKSHTLKPTFF